MMPYGYIVIRAHGGSTNEVLPWTVGVGLFTLLVFIIGCAMGIGKAAVYKHIPEYFPHDVGAVGGLVGSIGALGGFFLPPLFAYATAWSGAPQATFGVLFAVTLIIGCVDAPDRGEDAAPGQPGTHQQVRIRDQSGAPGLTGRTDRSEPT
jgi:nitrate/nitrite transporter NarK